MTTCAPPQNSPVGRSCSFSIAFRRSFRSTALCRSPENSSQVHVHATPGDKENTSNTIEDTVLPIFRDDCQNREEKSKKFKDHSSHTKKKRLGTLGSILPYSPSSLNLQAGLLDVGDIVQAQAPWLQGPPHQEALGQDAGSRAQRRKGRVQNEERHEVPGRIPGTAVHHAEDPVGHLIVGKDQEGPLTLEKNRENDSWTKNNCFKHVQITLEPVSWKKNMHIVDVGAAVWSVTILRLVPKWFGVPNGFTQWSVAGHGRKAANGHTAIRHLPLLLPQSSTQAVVPKFFKVVAAIPDAQNVHGLASTKFHITSFQLLIHIVVVENHSCHVFTLSIYMPKAHVFGVRAIAASSGNNDALSFEDNLRHGNGISKIQWLRRDFWSSTLRFRFAWDSILYIYTYIHIYIYTYIHLHVYIYIYVYIHIYIYTYIHLHIYIYIHTYIHIHIHTFTYIYIYIHTYIHIHIHTFTYIYIYIHIYIYT